MVGNYKNWYLQNLYSDESNKSSHYYVLTYRLKIKYKLKKIQINLSENLIKPSAKYSLKHLSKPEEFCTRSLLEQLTSHKMHIAEVKT